MGGGRCLALLSLLAVCLGACVRPGPLEPVRCTRLPAAMPGCDAPGVTVTRDDPWPRWWQVFHDPVLERLVAEARTHNPDLLEAFARVRAARGMALVVGAGRYPALDAGGSLTRQRRGAGSSRVGSTSAGEAYDVWSFDLDASWEIDVAGRLARATEAAVRDLAAVEQDRRAVEMTLTAEVARAWYDLLAARAESAILDDTVRLLAETRTLIEARVGEGVGPELDLRRIEGAEAAARSRLPEAERKAQVASHRLSVLLGEVPGRDFAAPEPGFLDLLPDVPVGLPATLVRRRPDVRAAEERLLASHARLAEAIAAFYPSITLVGQTGRSTLDLADLMGGAAVFYAFGPQIRVPIFAGGRLAATQFQRLAEQDAETAAYVSTVLQAFAEVADAVDGLSARLASREHLQVAVASQRRAVELSRAQYEAELVNYLPVLDSQTALAENRLALLAAERDLREEVIRLGKALGGGWEPSSTWCAPRRPVATAREPVGATPPRAAPSPAPPPPPPLPAPPTPAPGAD